MGQHLTYYHQRHWVTEGSPWRPPEVITLRDEAGVVIASTQMATMLMTLYDLSGGVQAIVNGVDGTTDVKNTRGCTLSTQGVFVLNLLPADTVTLDETKFPEVRCVLIQYTWPLAGTKSDCLEIIFCVRPVKKRPTVLV